MILVSIAKEFIPFIPFFQESLREEVTPYEFLCFILTQNESGSMDEIKQIMANFSELDVTKRGLLTQQTVDEWLRPCW